MNSVLTALQEDWRQWGIAVAVVVVTAVVLRIAKKNEWSDKTRIAGEKCGLAFSALLMHWLPVTAAEKAEEGIVVTLLHLVKSFIEGFEIGLLLDNAKRIAKREKR